MKTAVGTCTGYATEDLTDTKLGKMKAKATAGAVAKAMTTAREGGCAGDHADDAYKNCVETAVGEACKAAKGTVCSKKTIELQRSQGAASKSCLHDGSGCAIRRLCSGTQRLARDPRLAGLLVDTSLPNPSN